MSPQKPNYSHRQIADDIDEEINRCVVESKGPNGITTTTTTHKSSLINGKRRDVGIVAVKHPDGSTDVTESYLEGG